jgi:hypothetical protein
VVLAVLNRRDKKQQSQGGEHSPTNAGFLITGSSNDRAASLDQANQHNHKGDQEKYVNVAAQRVRTHHPQHPQHENYYEDRPQHVSPPVRRRAARNARMDSLLNRLASKFLHCPPYGAIAVRIGRDLVAGMPVKVVCGWDRIAGAWLYSFDPVPRGRRSQRAPRSPEVSAAAATTGGHWWSSGSFP